MKMTTWKKIASCVLSGLLLCSCVACDVKEDSTQRVLTEKEIVALGDKIPDYASSNEKFDFFAYSSLSDGTFEVGGVTYSVGEDFRTLERIEEYLESGLNIVMPQSTASVAVNAGEGFNFERSDLKKVMDLTQEAGGKLIVTDYRLYAMVQKDGSVGEGKLFENEEAIDAVVRKYMESYVNHPAFYGLQLCDEPDYWYFAGLGDVYKSIQRCYPGTKVFMNKLPPVTGIRVGDDEAFPVPTQEEKQAMLDQGYSVNLAEFLASWKKYLEMFLDATGAEYIMYDQYPLGSDYIGQTYVCGLQIAAKLAKERNVDLILVSQTYTPDSANTRTLTEEDLRWLNNMSMGFGIDQIAYYTYWQRSEQTYCNAFMTYYGDKTSVYYDMQKILTENQKFAPVIKSFDYVTSGWFTQKFSSYDASHIQVCAKGSFAKISDFVCDKETVLISELYDNGNNRYMYMIQNAIDPAYKASTTYQTATMTFTESYAYAVVWKNGEQSVVKLVGNKYSVTQHPGEAVYVIPFNA